MIIATVTKRKKKLHWVIPCQIIQGMSPLPKDFLFLFFTSGRYHKHVKIRKILASNSRLFRFYGLFQKWEIYTESIPANIQNVCQGTPSANLSFFLNAMLHFLRLLLLKITDGLQISHDYVF